MDTNKTPHQLAEERLQEAYDIALLGEMLVDVYKEKAKLWPEFRKEAKSTVEADRRWEMTDQGLLEKEIKVKIRAKEHKISALRTYLEVLQGESHNQY